jgi:hypothetical protein
MALRCEKVERSRTCQALQLFRHFGLDSLGGINERDSVRERLQRNGCDKFALAKKDCAATNGEILKF